MKTNETRELHLYPGEVLDGTIERIIKGHEDYELNVAYFNSEGKFFWYRNSKGYFHILQPKKLRSSVTGEVRLYLIDSMLTDNDTTREVDRFQFDNSKEMKEWLDQKFDFSKHNGTNECVGTVATIAGPGGYEKVNSGNPILAPGDSILPFGRKRKSDNQEEVDEGMKEYVQMALVASMLAVPGFVDAKDIEKAIPNKPTASQIQDAVKAVSPETFGGYSLVQAVNLITRTLYAEARGESLEGKEMVATVIWNRAGGDPEKFVKVCLKASQFSAWNKTDKSTLKPGVYNVKIPHGATSNPISKKAWDQCKDIATNMFAKSFTPLGTWNAYLNPKTADKSALNSWGTTMTNKKVVGKHRFGYLTDQDPNYKPVKVTKVKNNTHKVKQGETVSKIAAKMISNGETDVKSIKELVDKIVRLNNLKNGGNDIRVDQILKLPERKS